MNDVLTFLQIWDMGGLGRNRQNLLEFIVQALTLSLSETLLRYIMTVRALSFLFKSSLRKNLNYYDELYYYYWWIIIYYSVNGI